MTLTEEEYEAWSEKYHAASVAVDDREEEMDNVASEIEQQLRLVGATAIEDKLQDGVPEAIADLKKAGIKVWVATGDKLETAIAIGHSTNLITDESNLIVIRGGSENVARPTWSQLVHAAQAFFPDSGIVDEHGKLVDDTLYTPPSSAASHGPATSYGFGTNRARLPSGRSSVVGHDNGNRPGGFILVIDGNALEVVSIIYPIFMTHIYL
jgi:phospholipid-translocating ATPase